MANVTEKSLPDKIATSLASTVTTALTLLGLAPDSDRKTVIHAHHRSAHRAP